jgi:flagellar motor switch protein FliN/FliY
MLCALTTCHMSISQSDIDSLLSAANSLAAPEVDEPEPVAAPVRDAPGTSPPQVITSSPPRKVSRKLARLLQMRVPVIVKLAESQMPLAGILNLTNGSILEFDRPADAELELMVNNKVIGYGQAVKVGENFGLRIGRIGEIRDKIRALGKSQSQTTS